MPSNIPVNITGASYKHSSLPLSAQVTRNWLPQLQQNASTRSKYILTTYPGKKLFASIAGSRDRGMIEHLGVVYKVTDTTLYSVDSAGTETSLGAIPGSARCIIVGINTNIVIVTEGVPYVWNGSSVVTVSDVDLETPNGAAHLNNQIIYDGDGGRFVTSDVGDATSIDGLNYATAESDADDLIRVYVFDQLAYMMGDKTIETWWNSGVGKPPFDRVEGGIMRIGLQALHSVANSVNFMYFLGTDNQVYQVQGSVATPISTQPITDEIAKYSLASDAVGYCMNLSGQWLYVLTFITANKTFVFQEGGQTFEISNGEEGSRDSASSYVYAYRKHLVGDFDDGNIYELDTRTYTNKGNAIIRVRDTAPLHGGLFGKEGVSFEVTRFELIVESGIGLLSGQGIDPVIMLSVSNDSKTFSTEMWGTIGKIGQFRWKIEWFGLGTFDSCVFRVRTSDPVPYSIHSASIDVEVGI